MSYTEQESPGGNTYTQEEVERIIGGIEGDAAFLNTPSTKELKKRYEFLAKKNISLRLHMTTLGEYFKVQRIPRGIRSHLRPNLFAGDIAYCKRFENLSNKYAFDFILMNIEYLQGEVNRIATEMLEVDAILQVQLVEEEYCKFKDFISTILSKFQNEAEEGKRTKWQRDMNDYKRGSIYNWQSETSGTNNGKEYNNKRKRKNVQIPLSDDRAFLENSRTLEQEKIRIEQDAVAADSGDLGKPRNNRTRVTSNKTNVKKK